MIKESTRKYRMLNGQYGEGCPANFSRTSEQPVEKKAESKIQMKFLKSNFGYFEGSFGLIKSLSTR